MINIGLLSDTHGDLDERVFHHFKDCDEIWHAGDIGAGVIDQLRFFKPLHAVYGNIDDSSIRWFAPEFVIRDIAGLRSLIIHIAGRPPKFNANVSNLIQKYQPDILVCGHSHICAMLKDEKKRILYINPGAAVRHGFHAVRTLMRLGIDSGKLLKAEVIELGPRSIRWSQ